MNVRARSALFRATLPAGALIAACLLSLHPRDRRARLRASGLGLRREPEGLPRARAAAPQQRLECQTPGPGPPVQAPRQEYVGFQVIARAGAQPLKPVEVRVTPLRSAAGPTSWRRRISTCSWSTTYG